MAPELLSIIFVAMAAAFVLLPESISPRFVPWLLLLNYVKELDGTRALFYRLRFMLIWLVLSCTAAFVLAHVIDQVIVWLATLANKIIDGDSDFSRREVVANQLFETRLVIVPLLVVTGYSAAIRHIKRHAPNETHLRFLLENSVTDAEGLSATEAALSAPRAIEPHWITRVSTALNDLAKRILDHCRAPFDFEFELWLRHGMAELLFARFGEKNVLKALLCEPQLVHLIRKTNDETIVKDSLELLQTGTRTAIHKRAGQLLIDVFATTLGFHVLQSYIKCYLQSTCAQTIAGNSAPTQRPRRTHTIGVHVEYEIVGDRQLREAELVNVTQSGANETGLFLGTGSRQFLSQRPISVVRPAPSKATVEFIHREAQVMRRRIISGWGVRIHRSTTTAPDRDHSRDSASNAWQHIVL